MSENTLSTEQSEAVQKVHQWLKDLKNGITDEKIFRLFGYAGTGKTTIAKTIADGYDGTVKFAAYTGKASHVLRTKGCTDASTIHSLIYNPKMKSKEHLSYLKLELSNESDPLVIESLNKNIREEKENLNRIGFTLNLESALLSTDLLIVDEASMIGQDIGNDLMFFNCPILALGDPAQLPPVRDNPFFNPTDPDVMLTEIHRQALDSPILRWATRIRMGKGLPCGEREECFVKPIKDINDFDIQTADIIIAGKNDTRHSLNDWVRKNRGYGERHRRFEGLSPFVEGERLMCLKNNRDFSINNGAVYSVLNILDTNKEYTLATLRSDDGVEFDVPIANPMSLPTISIDISTSGPFPISVAPLTGSPIPPFSRR